MKTILELKQDRTVVEGEIDALLEKIEKATDEQVDELNKELADIEARLVQVDKSISLKEKAEKHRQKNANRRASAERNKEDRKISERYSIGRAVRIAMGKEDFNGVEREMHDEALKDSTQQKAEGVVMPRFLMDVGFDNTKQIIGKKRDFGQSRDHTVGTATEGGHTVDTVLGDFIPVLKPTPIIKNLGATIFTGLKANLDMSRGTSRATAAWEGEIDPNAETSMAFDRINLRPKRVGAFAVESKQLVLQSSIDIDRYLQNGLSDAIDEALDLAAFEGSGVDPVPEGIENTSGIGSVVTAGTMTEALAYGFKDDLAAAFALKGNLAFVTTPGHDSTMRQIPIEAGSGLRLLGGVGGQGNDIMVGYPVLTSDILTTGNIIFGNWSELVLAQWGGIDIVVNPYSLDTTNQIRITVNSWWDVDVKHAASFSMATDMT